MLAPARGGARVGCFSRAEIPENDTSLLRRTSTNWRPDRRQLAALHSPFCYKFEPQQRCRFMHRAVVSVRSNGVNCDDFAHFRASSRFSVPGRWSAWGTGNRIREQRNLATTRVSRRCSRIPGVPGQKDVPGQMHAPQPAPQGSSRYKSDGVGNDRGSFCGGQRMRALRAASKN